MLLRIFEAAIRDHPEQWHVLDPIWPATGTR
jgi:lauroyl/myristoyl acyltransferase